MKKIIICCCFALQISYCGIAQNIGINNNNPQVALDISGAISLRPDSILPLSAAVTMLDVTNKSFIKFSNNTTSAVPRFIGLTPGKPGQLLTLEFLGTYLIGILDRSMLSNGGRLLLNGDFYTSTHSLLQLVFTDNSWKETSRNTNISSFQDTYTKVYNNEGSSTFTVPPGITLIKVYLWGAAGGGGGGGTGIGGIGGFISGSLEVTPGEVLNVTVGNGGDTISAGATFIKRNNTYLVVAGAGGNGSNSGGRGGSTAGIAPTLGSGVTGGTGQNATATLGGNGGSSGTNGTIGQAGSAYNGGDNGTTLTGKGDGYGGDGWFGGGGAGTYCTNFNLICFQRKAAGGGGAGSNHSGWLMGTIVNGIAALGSGSPYYVSCCNSGFGAGVGQPGRIVIEY